MTDRAAAPSAPGPVRTATGDGSARAEAGAVLPARSVSGLLPGLRAGFSTALPRLPDAELAPLLRGAAARAWGEPAERVPAPLLLRQTHSPDVLDADAEPEARPAVARDAGAGGVRAGLRSPAGDGAQARAGTARLLAVKTADCVPLLAVDPETGRYAALHAGWRGTAAGILERLLAAWRAGGSSLAAVRLELGPHIQGCCYEVGPDCLAHFAPEALGGDALRHSGGRTTLHLAAVLRGQARRGGVPAAQVHVWPHCTYCHRDAAGAAPYASYRRATHAGTGFTGTNAGLIGAPGAPR